MVRVMFNTKLAQKKESHCSIYDVTAQNEGYGLHIRILLHLISMIHDISISAFVCTSFCPSAVKKITFVLPTRTIPHIISCLSLAIFVFAASKPLKPLCTQLELKPSSIRVLA